MINAPLLTGIRRVALGVRDLDQAVDFYTETWGLEPVSRTTDLCHLAAAGSDEPFVLRLRSNDVNRLDVVTLAAHDRPAVSALVARAEATGCRVLQAPGAVDAPGGGYGARFLDPEGRVFEVVADVLPRQARRLHATESVPIGLSHIVLNTPDSEGMAAFLVDVLGLKVSDYLEDKMVFLRCQQVHHTVALATAPHVNVNHVAFEVLGVDEFMRATGRLIRAGHPLVWGPGRHGPGNNTFAYFHDPNRFIAEFVTGLEVIADESTWEPRVFRSIPEESDVWGTSNPRPGEPFVGEPDPGVGTPPPV
jgi:catechol 2,3-dioxygenase-like lactoylglutathione lyase family enzyme